MRILRAASYSPSKALASLPVPIPTPTRPNPYRNIIIPTQNSSHTTVTKTQFKVSSLPTANPQNKPPFGILGSCHPSRRTTVAMASSGSVPKSEEEWRAVLSPEQFRILRMKGTEFPGTGEYDKLYGEGVYECAGCGTPLYKSTTKFNSGCGWPAFYEGLPGAINRTELG